MFCPAKLAKLGFCIFVVASELDPLPHLQWEAERLAGDRRPSPLRAAPEKPPGPERPPLLFPDPRLPRTLSSFLF